MWLFNYAFSYAEVVFIGIEHVHLQWVDYYEQGGGPGVFPDAVDIRVSVACIWKINNRNWRTYYACAPQA